MSANWQRGRADGMEQDLHYGAPWLMPMAVGSTLSLGFSSPAPHADARQLKEALCGKMNKRKESTWPAPCPGMCMLPGFFFFIEFFF